MAFKEMSFDAERQSMQAQDRHLQQRLKSLAPQPSASQTASKQTDAAISLLQEELSSLSLSHSALLTQLKTVTGEVHELKVLNASLQEENEGWEFLLRERTLSGKVLEGSGLLSRGVSQDETDVEAEPKKRSGRRVKQINELDALDEELEMDELNSDLDAQTPILEHAEEGFVFNLDAGVTTTDDGYLAPPMRTGRGTAHKKVAGLGLDLAAELEKADEVHGRQKLDTREGMDIEGGYS
jgi:hypothetical protein